jgi:hydrogenase nickel incorporation protein HypA/HybF
MIFNSDACFTLYTRPQVRHIQVRPSAAAKGSSVHELSLMEETLSIAIAHAQREGAQRIHLLTMRVGALSGVVPEALEFAFGILARGTMADGAQLRIETVPIAAYCTTCGQEFETADLLGACPRCGETATQLRHGRELELGSLEVS